MEVLDLDAYIVPTADPHQSEYLPDYYKTRQFITGFTGSAGTAVITKKDAGLWTDSRYFLQAAEELRHTPFTLYKMGTEDPTLEDYLIHNTPPFGKIGFDGACMSLSMFKKLKQSLGSRALIYDVDYITDIWQDRPALPDQPAFALDEKYTGRSIEDKLRILRFMMADREVDFTFIAAPEDVNYLFNLRGWDVQCTPVILSYALISKDQAILFIAPEKLSDPLKDQLHQAGVWTMDYDMAMTKVEALPTRGTIYLDPDRTSVLTFKTLPAGLRVQTGINLTSLMKAIKNEVEIENIKEAFLKDGVALMRFFNWIEMGARSETVDEKLAVEKLRECRKKQDNYLEDSFEAIIGYGANAAIVHYNPMNNRNPATLKGSGLLLVDSGGQYLEGTTDITRTYAMGPTSPEEKKDYTLVLKAHIAGMTAVFPKGTTGAYLHFLTRAPLFQEGMDYQHGTGHGVGHVLSCHEGPQSISARGDEVEIVPGMVTSMEPGLYIEGKHGIRTESIMLCREKETSEWGTFYEFEPLTWVPIDTRPLDLSLLSDFEIDWLNAYNKTCFEKLSPRMKDEGDDLLYLKTRCQPVKKISSGR